MACFYIYTGIRRIMTGKPREEDHDETQHLVDAEQPVCDDVEGKVFLQAVLVNGILAFLHSRHVVTEVPHVDLPVKLVAILLTLKVQKIKSNLLRHRIYKNDSGVLTIKTNVKINIISEKLQSFTSLDKV